MHAKATFLIAASLSAAASLSVQAQTRAASPFAASSPAVVAPPANAAPAAQTQPPSAPVPAASSAASAAVIASAQTISSAAASKSAGPLLSGAPTIAQLSSLQQAALQADARKKAAELYAVPEAASSPAPVATRRVDPFVSAVPKPAPALMKVAAILGRTGEESVEIRDAAGRVAIYAAGMVVGDWQLVEVRADAVLLRRVELSGKPEPVRHRKPLKAPNDTVPTTRLIPLGGEFPASSG